jgi:hypothetical protein
VVDVVVHIMHRDSRAGGRRVRYLARGACETETLGTGWVDAYLACTAGIGGAASTLYGELPVRAIGLVAGGQRRIGCA